MDTNTVYNCNCLDLMALMPNNFIDLTVTSPPYDNIRDYNGYSFEFEKIAKELYRVINKIGKRNNIWSYAVGMMNSSSDKLAFEHPAIFPEKLCQDHIISWSNKNDLVFDPFMGSGTTLKMCIRSNRNYIGSEISEEYCNLMDKRFKHMKYLKLFKINKL